MRNFMSYVLASAFVVLLLAVVTPPGFWLSLRGRRLRGRDWRPKSLIAPANRTNCRSRKRLAVG
jgi:hypothetical protein